MISPPSSVGTFYLCVGPIAAPPFLFMNIWWTIHIFGVCVSCFSPWTSERKQICAEEEPAAQITMQPKTTGKAERNIIGVLPPSCILQPTTQNKRSLTRQASPHSNYSGIRLNNMLGRSSCSLGLAALSISIRPWVCRIHYIFLPSLKMMMIPTPLLPHRPSDAIATVVVIPNFG